MNEVLWEDQDENGLRIDAADVDGFHIVETSFERNKVYVYYSDIEKLVSGLLSVSIGNDGVRHRKGGE